MRLGYRFGLVASAVLVLLAYKSIAIAAREPVPILLGWALEGASLWLLWALSELGQRSGFRPLRAALAGLFYLLFYVIVVCSLAHTYFFDAAAERRFSLFELDLRTLGYFFASVLPRRGLLLLFGLLLAIHVLALWVMRFGRALRPLKTAPWLLVAWLLLGAALANQPRVPSPVADMAADLWEQLTTPEVVVDRSLPARYAPELLDKSASALPPGAPQFDKVLVFVMETMTSATLERERRALPSESFVRRAPARGHVYTRYFATNQDSRTGMLAMLGARFIPYEAYTEQGRDRYMFLGQKSSLVELFARLGYHTAFAVSQAEIELVVGDLPWDERIHLREGESAALSGQYLCFVPYEFEHSCEDRALLPRVLEAIDQNPRLFLYQEFIWGHAAAYNQASGKTNTAYYSAYLDLVREHLTRTGALERTLIVLSSDHGFRDRGLQSERSVYQIPLLFHATSFDGAEDARLFSHLDFKDLLLHELFAGSAAPAENPFVMVVGPTGTSFLAVLTRSDEFLLMRARAGERYLVHAERLAGRAARQTASEFLRLYDDYLAYFARL